MSNIDKLYAYANEALKDVNFNEGVYEVDFKLSDISTDLNDLATEIEEHKGFFGQGNPEPLIYIDGIQLEKSDITFMGENKDTIKIMIKGVPCLKFKDAELADKLRNIDYPVMCAGVAKTNTNVWMGRKTMQLIFEAVEFKSVNKDLMEGF